jgi:hypothetical protein
MNALHEIQTNPKTNIWGGLGSRNRIPAAVNVPFSGGLIWCITSRQAIYSTGRFNECIDLTELADDILIQINEQLR